MAKVKKILITGGAGFIGSAFVRQGAQKKGWRMHVMDSLTYAGDIQRLDEVKRCYSFHKVDICNKSKVEQVLKKVKPDIIVHFAAETHVDRSILYAQKAVKTNVLGTQVLLEAARVVGVSKFIYISTDEVYGDIKKGQFYETTPLNPSSPYSVGKASGDMLTRAYVRTYDFPGIVVRPSNNYGAWQYPEKLLPVVIYKAMRGQKVPVYGKGVNIREWLHVDDCARGVWTIVQKGEVGEIYNIGSGNECQNIQIIKKILDIMGRSHDLIEFIQDRPGHDIRYSVSHQKIKKHLGWEARMPLEKGLKETVDFYQEHSGWLDVKVKSVQRLWRQVYKK